MYRFIQKAIKVYPATYKGENLDELNKHLSDGYIVCHVVLSVDDKEGNKVYDYILMKTIEKESI